MEFNPNGAGDIEINLDSQDVPGYAGGGLYAQALRAVPNMGKFRN